MHLSNLVRLVVLCPLLLVSCISHIGVKKINNNDVNAATKVKGIRYSLPQPFVIGTPQLNGKISYRVEYLPDPDNEYSVNAWSFMAKHKMKVVRFSNGMLKSVSYSKDDTPVATSMVDTAGNLANAQLKAMTSHKPSSADTSDTKGEPPEPAHVNTTAAGPVIYRVVEDPQFGVRLEPVSFKVTINGGKLTRDQQKIFETTGSPDATTDPTPTGDKIALKNPVTDTQTLTLHKNENTNAKLVIPFTFNTKVNLDPKDYRLEDADGKPFTSACEVTMEETEKTRGTAFLTKHDIENGSYVLKLKVTGADKPSLVGNGLIRIKVEN